MLLRASQDLFSSRPEFVTFSSLCFCKSRIPSRYRIFREDMHSFHAYNWAATQWGSWHNATADTPQQSCSQQPCEAGRLCTTERSGSPLHSLRPWNKSASPSPLPDCYCLAALALSCSLHTTQSLLKGSPVLATEEYDYLERNLSSRWRWRSSTLE